MSQDNPDSTQPTKPVLDYSAWERSSSENATINTPSFDFIDETEYGDTARIKIPRSPRPQPAEPPVLHNPDGLLEPPPINVPKGVMYFVCHVYFHNYYQHLFFFYFYLGSRGSSLSNWFWKKNNSKKTKS